MTLKCVFLLAVFLAACEGRIECWYATDGTLRDGRGLPYPLLVAECSTTHRCTSGITFADTHNLTEYVYVNSLRLCAAQKMPVRRRWVDGKWIDEAQVDQLDGGER